jgi:site-specific DNA-methyltransferase (adenine-specific)
LVEHFSNPGELVVVPFVGSGSECVAALECGRRFVGSEINLAYVEIARERIAAVSLQQRAAVPLAEPHSSEQS